MPDESNQLKHNNILRSEKKMLLSIFLVGTVLTGKLIGAFITNSLALFSDSWHLLTDLASLLISWWGLKAAAKPANNKFTFGHYRHSILTALINNVSLICISIFILYKSVERYLKPVEVEPKGMILLAILGLAVNLIIVYNLKNNSNVNVKSAFLHFVGDALADVGVLLGGTIIYFTKWYGIDTLLSAFLGCFILKSAVKMTIECLKILLEAVPDHISLEKMKERIKSIDGVIEITDLHVWSLSAEVQSMTAHICVQECSSAKCKQLLRSIQNLLKDEFDIEHTTIQFELSLCGSCYYSSNDDTKSCMLCIDSQKSKGTDL